ncbi:hypothetical protein NEIELOOT_00263 [Neisseria elongata subsp. glycolytica ATCC 29315]|uniref:Uncharacterized protein n=1 Tax=Neisseria elongata subsp. glycolytica ATCC 29315 TaxID=546263 RepID=D4DMJ5_NEIEG|nr:hypothetical protein NEIELOOT_00263 [Neisseria elongata subsp. glycolytica ATCC 29315]
MLILLQIIEFSDGLFCFWPLLLGMQNRGQTAVFKCCVVKK